MTLATTNKTPSIEDQEELTALEPAEGSTPSATLEVTLRNLVDADRPFVASSWLRSNRQDNTWNRKIDKNAYFANHGRLVERILDTDGAVIVCSSEYPQLIFGFACGRVYKSAILLHYVYVKKKLRQKGLARFLLEPFGWGPDATKPIVATHWTWLMDHFKTRFPIGYNPYLLWQEYRRALDVTEESFSPAIRDAPTGSVG